MSVDLNYYYTYEKQQDDKIVKLRSLNNKKCLRNLHLV